MSLRRNRSSNQLNTLSDEHFQPKKATTSSSQQSQSTDSDHARFRDLMIFEERLKFHMHRLRKDRQKMEALLGFLVVVALSLFGLIFFYPSDNATLQLLYKGLLIITGGLMLYIANCDKMREASRYLPYCNQTLRMYGMSFDRNNQGELSFHRHISRRIQDGYAAYRDLIKRKKASQRNQHRT